MRKAVLTGLLACALTFVVTPAKAEASTLNIFKTDANELPSLDLAVSSVGLVQLVEQSEPLPDTNEPETLTHVVERSETLSDIAKEYETTWQRIFDKNTSLENPDLINAGEELLIPAEDEELEPRELQIEEPVARPSRTVQTVLAKAEPVPRGSSSGNSYSAGYCTWYTKNKRPDLPNGLGNARTWAIRAAAQGLPTGTTARVGAIGVRGNHTVYVESINSNGTINISEMNFNGGLFKVNYRTLDPSTFTFIY